MRHGALLILCALGCGRVGFQHGDPGPVEDGGALSDGALDGGMGGWRFGPAVRMDELSELGSDEDDPTLTEDMLEIYFEHEPRFGDSDIFVARRTSVSEPFGTPVRAGELSSPERDSTPEISADGLTIYLASARLGGGATSGLDVFVSTRASRGAPWSTPVVVAGLNTGRADLAPAISADGREALFASARDAPSGSSDLDLYRARRAGPADPWGTPERVAELSTSGSDVGPFGWTDLGEIFFATSGRGSAGTDIWTARRDATGTYGSFRRLDELATRETDSDPWVSADGRLIVFASNRAGSLDIYFAVR